MCSSPTYSFAEQNFQPCTDPSSPGDVAQKTQCCHSKLEQTTGKWLCSPFSQFLSSLTSVRLLGMASPSWKCVTMCGDTALGHSQLPRPLGGHLRSLVTQQLPGSPVNKSQTQICSRNTFRISECQATQPLLRAEAFQYLCFIFLKILLTKAQHVIFLFDKPHSISYLRLEIHQG